MVYNLALLLIVKICSRQRSHNCNHGQIDCIVLKIISQALKVTFIVVW